MIKLIGAASDDAGATAHAANFIYLTRFQAEVTGSVRVVRVKAGASGNAKVAVYADSAGEPGAVVQSTAGGAVVSGWNDIVITAVPVTSGTYYWLCVRVDTNNAAIYNNGSGTMRYKALAYASAFPDPAGAGYSSASYHSVEAGWTAFTPQSI